MNQHRFVRGTRRHQRGVTFFGALCILGLVALDAYAGLRLAPLYLNYMKVARSMDSAAADNRSENPDPGLVRRSLERHWQIEDISGVEAKEVEVVRDDSGVALHLAYDDAAPFIANVSLSVHFEKTVKLQ
jgi:hypothetical protein